ncbi:MAG TPA: DUF4286 family protein [Flavisolibacter sp.]|nr:DUF4286 family protein [Flavisolibacter sp.]
MIIYNVTTKVEDSIAEDWLQWMMEEHIPEVLGTRCFSEYKLVKLLEVDDAEGPTYAVQYLAESKADYNRYIQIHAATLRKKTIDKWGTRVIAFRSVMQVVQ